MSKERPIIMSSESVRAILEGRKTQTRRVIKPQPRLEDEWNEVTGPAWSVWWKIWEESFENVYEELPSFCPLKLRGPSQGGGPTLIQGGKKWPK